MLEGSHSPKQRGFLADPITTRGSFFVPVTNRITMISITEGEVGYIIAWTTTVLCHINKQTKVKKKQLIDANIGSL
jgi:hypothetical protein